MLFSQRKGIKPVNKIMQHDNIDLELKNGLWNALEIFIWRKYSTRPHPHNSFKYSNLFLLYSHYWITLLKLPIDKMPYEFSNAKEYIRKHFYNCSWNEVYDLIEFTANACNENMANPFIEFCNEILERENSAYRFIDSQLTQITDLQEIESIKEAIEKSDKYYSVKTHLSTAMKYLSDRNNPDYRNSIKESISAVEAIAKLISNNDKATLGEALNEIEKNKKIHSALKKSLSSLYGYTNDSDGIRHSLLEESTLNYDDAKFIFVSCTAFINYLISQEKRVNAKL